MSNLAVAQLFAALCGVLGVLAPGVWYLYYRRISSRLMRQRASRTTRQYVRSRFVLLSLESTLACAGYAVYWYVRSLQVALSPRSQAWFIAGIVGSFGAVVVLVVQSVTHGQLRKALRSVEQTGPGSMR